MELKRFLGNFAKLYLAIGALSVSAFAGADDYNCQNCQPLCPPPISNQNCCGVPCCPPPTCAWGYNPPGYCRCGNPDNGCNSFLDNVGVRVDFLWWRVCEQGLALGSEETLDTFATSATRSTVINSSRIKKPNFKYDPGFRIGIGANCPDGCWDIALDWTHFHSKANANGASVSATEDFSSTTTFVSYWDRLIGIENPQVVRGRHSLTLDLLDLSLGRKYYVSSCFVVRPSIGLRGARIDQTFRVDALRNAATAATVGLDYDSDVKARNDFLAIGPRVTLDAEVHLGCGLIIFGNAGGSIVFGKFDRHSRQNYRDFTTSTPAVVNEFEYEAKSNADRCSRTFTDLSIGVKWNHCFDWCNRLHPVSIAFAWEHHAFYNLNNFLFGSRGYDIENGELANGGARKHGDLYTQGLTVSASIGF